jgi:dTDP-4-dehydrorhamnose reductase
MSHYMVTGASGLLGLNFALAVDGRQHQVTGVDYRNPLGWINFKTRQADLIEAGIIERLFDEIKPEVILHCAAMANVDDCEKRPQDAQRVNADLPGELAIAAKKHSVKLVHISTDAVFDGQKGNYTEEEDPEPLSVYARTKREGERAVISANSQALIARVNFYGWSISGSRSLAEFFVNNLSEGRDVKGFTDIRFCPMMVLDLAATLVESVEKDLIGLYHSVGPESMSKYDFGLAIARQFGFDETLVHPASVADGGLTAARSPDLTLSTRKLAEALGHPLPGFIQGLTKFHNQYRHGFPQMIRSLV